jgi:hypothetical protein
MESIKLVKKELVLIFSVIFFMLLSVQTISAIPPVQTNVNTDVGYTIYYPQYQYVPVNSSFTLHIYVSNRSNSLIIPNTDITCFLRLFNSTGQLTLESKPLEKFAVNRQSINISSGNFSDFGLHAFFIWCNSSAFGGEASGVFEVTYSGIELTTARSIFNVGLLAILIFLFLVNVFGITAVPSENSKDEFGQILDVNNLKYFKGTLFITAWGLLIALLFTASNLSFAYLSTSMFGSLFFKLFQITAWLTIPFILVWLLWLFVNIFKDKEIKTLLSRGVQIGGDV